MVRRVPELAGAVLALALLLAADACDPTGNGPTPGPTASPTSMPTATPTSTPVPTPKPKPSPTKIPFLWKLLLDGGSSFAGVKGAPVNSVCRARAFLGTPKSPGKEISGPALTPRAVTNESQGASWTESDQIHLLTLPSPPPPQGSAAYWVISCTNGALNPSSSGDYIQAFTTP